MGKNLVVRLGGVDLSLAPEKVDRERLYGRVETIALDEAGRRCHMATLAADGRTLIGRGGVALANLSTDGEWLDKKALKPVDLEGKPLPPVPSTFAAPVSLDRKASIDDVLAHDVKALYLLHPEGDGAALAADLRAGTIYTFPYSFRGGVEADVGFLLAGSEGDLFLLVAVPLAIRFVGLEQAVAAEGEEEAEADGDEELDFGMM